MKKPKDEKTFIKFTPLQRRLLVEVNRRHASELNSALDEIAKEHDVDFDDTSVQYILDKKMTGFNIVKAPSEEKENKTNGTEEEVSVEKGIVQGDEGDL
jgi:hypothetical protein